MAATRHGEKRRARKAAVRGRRRGTKGWAAPAVAAARPPAATGDPPRFVAVGTVADLAPAASPAGSALSFWVNGRFEVRVGADFEAAALARLVGTLERL